MLPKSVFFLLILFVGVHCSVLEAVKEQTVKSQQNATDIAPDAVVSEAVEEQPVKNQQNATDIAPDAIVSEAVEEQPVKSQQNATDIAPDAVMSEAVEEQPVKSQQNATDIAPDAVVSEAVEEQPVKSQQNATDIAPDAVVSDVVEERTLEKQHNAYDIAPDAFVSGGTAAQVGQFPWMAKLALGDGSDETFICGGSLISKTHVLTAAHCVKREPSHYYNLKIYLGEYNRNSFPLDCVQGECIKNLIVYHDKIIKHAQYNPATIENDIALLRLRNEAPVGGAIRVIPLPPFDIDDPTYDRIDVTVSGWGRTEDGKTSDILRTTELKLVTHERCREIDSDVPSGHLCAGDPNGRDTCSGDSGGPLMIYHRRKYYLSGVVSYGPSRRCGTADIGYYTNVFKYKNWIKTNMRV